MTQQEAMLQQRKEKLMESRKEGALKPEFKDVAGPSSALTKANRKSQAAILHS
jgi:hypothetical protein